MCVLVVSDGEHDVGDNEVTSSDAAEGSSDRRGKLGITRMA